jgi:hypothetical protein
MTADSLGYWMVALVLGLVGIAESVADAVAKLIGG